MSRWRVVIIAALLGAATAWPLSRALSDDQPDLRVLETKLDSIVATQKQVLSELQAVRAEFPKLYEELRVIKVRATVR